MKKRHVNLLILLLAGSGCAMDPGEGEQSGGMTGPPDPAHGSGGADPAGSGGDVTATGGITNTGGESSGGTTPVLPGSGGDMAATGGVAETGGAPATGGETSTVSCGEVTAPGDDVLTWLAASDLDLEDGATVSSWDSRSGASFGSGSAQFVVADDGSKAVGFSGGQKLYSNIGIAGLDNMTIALVSRTTVRSMAPGDWCQGFNMAISENGCSGTFNTPIMWDEAGDWGFTFVGTVQDQVSFRFGTGNKTYSNLDDPAIQALEYDPNVAWVRPTSIGDAWTSTVVQKEGGTMRLFVDGAQVLEQGLPGGPGVLANMHDSVWLGGGRGDFHWGGEIAEVIVYGRHLQPEEMTALNDYLLCEHPQVAP